jgi:hypothetical protein
MGEIDAAPKMQKWGWLAAIDKSRNMTLRMSQVAG